MGARLESDAEPIHASNALTGVSDAVSLGDVQVTGDGRPAILLADRQPTGGYPRIATVITADLPAAAQIPPGDTLRFRLVNEQEALAALARWRAELEQSPSRLQPLLRDPGDMSDLLSYQLTGGAIAGGDRLPWEEPA